MNWPHTQTFDGTNKPDPGSNFDYIFIMVQKMVNLFNFTRQDLLVIICARNYGHSFKR